MANILVSESFVLAAVQVGQVTMQRLVSQSCQLSVAPRTVAHQAPLRMEFSRQEYWSGLPVPPPF